VFFRNTSLKTVVKNAYDFRYIQKAQRAHDKTYLMSAFINTNDINQSQYWQIVAGQNKRSTVCKTRNMAFGNEQFRRLFATNAFGYYMYAQGGPVLLDRAITICSLAGAEIPSIFGDDEIDAIDAVF